VPHTHRIISIAFAAMGGEASRPLQDDSMEMRLYHERQKGSLGSGLHTINNLLQGPVATQRGLEKITKLPGDKADPICDHSLLRTPRKKVSFQYWSTIGKKCCKSDRDASKTRNAGFTPLVLQKALEPFGVRLLSPSDPELRGPEAAPVWGYVVHCGGHWSAMRQVGEHDLWVDLDSSLVKPQLMSAAEILRLQVGMPPKSGGLVFAVVGAEPPCPQKGGRRVVRLAVDPRRRARTHFNL